MLMDPETMMRLANTRLEELRRQAAAHRLRPCAPSAWHRIARHVSLRPHAGPCGEEPAAERQTRTRPLQT
jgi:hypothetical protein